MCERFFLRESVFSFLCRIMLRRPPTCRNLDPPVEEEVNANAAILAENHVVVQQEDALVKDFGCDKDLKNLLQNL